LESHCSCMNGNPNQWIGVRKTRFFNGIVYHRHRTTRGTYVENANAVSAQPGSVDVCEC
jgi:hypothetical protein